MRSVPWFWRLPPSPPRDPRKWKRGCRRFENNDHLFQVCGVFDRIPSVVACYLSRGIGYQGYLAGLLARTISTKTFSVHLPSMLNSVVTIFQCVHIRVADMPPSGRGCTVMPGSSAPKRLDVGGGDKIDCCPRLLRRVASLLMLTDLVMAKIKNPVK